MYYFYCKCYYRQTDRQTENKHLKPSLENPFRQPLTLRNYEVSQKREYMLFKQPIFHEPVPVAARSKAWVCDYSLAGIAGSNPAGGMDVCLL